MDGLASILSFFDPLSLFFRKKFVEKNFNFAREYEIPTTLKYWDDLKKWKSGSLSNFFWGTRENPMVKPRE